MKCPFELPLHLKYRDDSLTNQVMDDLCRDITVILPAIEAEYILAAIAEKAERERDE